MKHPFLQNKGYIPYTIAWVIVMIVHAFLLHLYYSLSLPAAVWDSVVHNLLYAGLGLALWFVVRYSPLNQGKFSGILINQVTSCLMAVALWLFTSKAILSSVLRNNTDYLDFLQTSTPGKVMAGVFIYFVIILIYYLVMYNRDLQFKRESELKLRSMVKEAELSRLKSQINPHFVFNSLNSISALTLSSPDRAHEMVIKLSDFLRYSVGTADTDIVPLKKELNYLNLYLEIEKVRFGEKLQVQQEVDENVDDIQVPTMILQPLLENAIKYGIHENLNPQPIQLTSKDQGEHIVITIVNHFEADAITAKGEGIGLKNIKSRLKLIYNSDDLLHLERTDSSFTVKLIIPRNKPGDEE